MSVTDQQIRALAFLAAQARPHGARQWDEQGIVAALRKVAHLELAEVMAAVANGAGDRTLEKPAALGNPASPCWRHPADRPAPRPAPVSRHRRCSICSEPEDTCRTRWTHDHDFHPDVRRPTAPPPIDQVRAAIHHPAPEPTEERTA